MSTVRKLIIFELVLIFIRKHLLQSNIISCALKTFSECYNFIFHRYKKATGKKQTWFSDTCNVISIYYFFNIKNLNWNSILKIISISLIWNWRFELPDGWHHKKMILASGVQILLKSVCIHFALMPLEMS